MASASRLHFRDQASGGSGGSSQLPLNAVIGIICGVAGLFILGAILLLVYCLRQRKFNEEDHRLSYLGTAYCKHGYFQNDKEIGDTSTIAPATASPQYTLDYKHGSDNASSSHSRSPDTTKSSNSTFAMDEVTGSMPAHPAYIPRALVRGAVHRPRYPTPATIDSTISSSTHSRSRAASDADNFGLQVYINIANDDSHAASAPAREPAAQPQDGTSNAAAMRYGRQPSVTVSTQRKPRPKLQIQPQHAQENPPLRQRETPIHGREDVTISGPLAFPAQHFDEVNNGNPSDHRTFKERAAYQATTANRPVPVRGAMRWSLGNRLSAGDMSTPPTLIQRPPSSDESDSAIYG